MQVDEGEMRHIAMGEVGKEARDYGRKGRKHDNIWGHFEICRIVINNTEWIRISK